MKMIKDTNVVVKKNRFILNNEKINHCISLINDLLFLFNKMKKYTISHIVNRLINVYSLYSIGLTVHTYCTVIYRK